MILKLCKCNSSFYSIIQVKERIIFSWDFHGFTHQATLSGLSVCAPGKVCVCARASKRTNVSVKERKKGKCVLVIIHAQLQSLRIKSKNEESKTRKIYFVSHQC